ncbi:MAG: hypothetical protein LAT63_14195 [Marinobacter sp.]|nr:hypothetical protein [Marinobacter sp.]
MNYRFFPFSILRSLNYSFLLAVPTIAKKKRFTGFNDQLPVNAATVLLCKIHVIAGVMVLIAGIPLLAIGLWGLFAL